jgi:hypothetical protein
MDAIGAIGPAASPAIPVLAPMATSVPGPVINERSPEFFAARALGRIGPASAAALPQLRALLAQPHLDMVQELDPQFELDVALAIGRIQPGDPQAFDVIESGAKEGTYHLRALALIREEQIASGDPQRVLAFAKSLLNDPEADVRETASRVVDIINKALSSGATTIPDMDTNDW